MFPSHPPKKSCSSVTQFEFNSLSFQYCSIKGWGTGVLISGFESHDWEQINCSTLLSLVIRVGIKILVIMRIKKVNEYKSA